MNHKKKLFALMALVFSLGVLMIGCKKKTKELPKTEPKKEVTSPKKKKEKELMSYTSFIFPKSKHSRDSAMAVFTDTYDKSEQHTILALNRLDLKNKWRADSLIIPKSIETDFLKYTPFPLEVELLQDVDKIALFSYPLMAYALYEHGKLVKWGPSSMGTKKAPTKKGLMFTNWKKEVAISTVDSSWKLRWNFNIHNTLGIGWHQYDLPGFHASHSCLRLLEEDAKWMYSWADMWVITPDGSKVIANGTPVIVYGETDYKTRPWLELVKDPASNEVSEKELADEISPFLEDILSSQENRLKVRAEREARKKES